MGFPRLGMELVQVTKESEQMKSLRKWFVLTVIASVLTGMLIAVLRLGRGEGKFFYEAKFTEFFVCEGPDPVSGFPQGHLTVVPSTAETIYACGYLEASGRVPLHFLLFHEGRALSWFDPVTDYQTGYTFKELPDIWREPGSYSVEVFLHRHKVASVEFQVIP